MKNIAMIRIDDRLMHGQVVVSWIPYLKADEVIILDDDYANDDFMSLLIKNASPENVKVHIFNFDDAVSFLQDDDDGAVILILIKNVEYIKRLMNKGINIKKVNVGNLGSSPMRKKYYNSVYLSYEELEMLKDIQGLTEVEIKMLPNDKALSLE